MADLLKQFRAAEIEALKSWFTPAARVVEIGGGSGYQAELIAQLGCDVASFDLPDAAVRGGFDSRVRPYDGRTIPVGDGTQDIVFSSSVLEHIRALPEMLAEIRRVLAPGGHAIHVLPTPAWRFWTSVAHYPYLVGRVLDRLAGSPAPAAAPCPADVRSGDRRGLASLLCAGPHGEYPGELSELWFFSRTRWRSVFAGSGFELLRIEDAAYFYTGQLLFPALPDGWRRALARILGPATATYIMRLARPVPREGEAPARSGLSSRP